MIADMSSHADSPTWKLVNTLHLPGMLRVRAKGHGCGHQPS
jgi:hypothetical protein